MPSPAIVIPLTIAAVLAAFYLWMFWTMATNRDLTTLPLIYVGVVVNGRSLAIPHVHWAAAFVPLNIAAPPYYPIESRGT